MSPEYEENIDSEITSVNDMRISLSRYFLENNLKLSLSYSTTQDLNDNASSLMSMIMQLRL